MGHVIVETCIRIGAPLTGDFHTPKGVQMRSEGQNFPTNSGGVLKLEEGFLVHESTYRHHVLINIQIYKNNFMISVISLSLFCVEPLRHLLTAISTQSFIH